MDYKSLVGNISALMEEARKTSVVSINTILTRTYWEIGYSIVVFEQNGQDRAKYGEKLLSRLSNDLKKKVGRGFSPRNLRNMRQFYIYWPKLYKSKLVQKRHAVSAKSFFGEKWLSESAKLSWTHYRRLLAVETAEAREFYKFESIRGNWSVRQLDRQISSQFYERTLLSNKKVSMLKKGKALKNGDLLSPEEEIKDPTILEFLNLKDEYSESELEEALIYRLEDFLLEMGYGFTFIGRQKRIRIGDEWYRIDLLLYHRKLRCLVVIDLKVVKFSHADAGQMNLYLNYANEEMTLPEENPPIGIILCAEQSKSVVHYALGNMNNKVFTSEYKLQLPNKKKLEKELKRAQVELNKLKD